jgi:hypothetical protein
MSRFRSVAGTQGGMFSNCGRSSGFAHSRRRLVNISSTGSMPSVFSQAAENDEDHAWEAFRVAGEHPCATIGAEVSIKALARLGDRGGRLGLNSVSVPIDGFPSQSLHRLPLRGVA